LNCVKTGFKKFRLYDFDKVVLHNVSNQLHGLKNVGMKKTSSLAELMRSQSPYEKIAIFEGADGTAFSFEGGAIVFCCVDNMKARREIFQTVRELAPEYYIDIRVGAFDWAVYCPKEHHNEYITTMTGKGSPLSCHARSYMISSMIASSFACQVMFDWVRGHQITEWKMFGNVLNGKITLDTNLTLKQKTERMRELLLYKEMAKPREDIIKEADEARRDSAIVTFGESVRQARLKLMMDSPNPEVLPSMIDGEGRNI